MRAFPTIFLLLPLLLPVPLCLAASCGSSSSPTSDDKPESRRLAPSNTAHGNLPYYFAESTGQNQWIEMDGKRIPIRLSSASNPTEKQLLQDLKWQVLYPNAEGKIILTGQVDLNTRHTDKEIPEDSYYEFTLEKWCIHVPFKKYDADEPTTDIPTVITVSELVQEDFDTPAAVTAQHLEEHICR